MGLKGQDLTLNALNAIPYIFTDMQEDIHTADKNIDGHTDK
jgi:hypothetical protein